MICTSEKLIVSLVIPKIWSHEIIAWIFQQSIKITRWKAQETWRHSYNTYFWWFQTLWNLAAIQVCPNIWTVNQNTRKVHQNYHCQKMMRIVLKNIEKKTVEKHLKNANRHGLNQNHKRKIMVELELQNKKFAMK